MNIFELLFGTCELSNILLGHQDLHMLDIVDLFEHRNILHARIRSTGIQFAISSRLELVVDSISGFVGDAWVTFRFCVLNQIGHTEFISRSLTSLSCHFFLLQLWIEVVSHHFKFRNDLRLLGRQDATSRRQVNGVTVTRKLGCFLWIISSAISRTWRHLIRLGVFKSGTASECLRVLPHGVIGVSLLVIDGRT